MGDRLGVISSCCQTSCRTLAASGKRPLLNCVVKTWFTCYFSCRGKINQSSVALSLFLPVHHNRIPASRRVARCSLAESSSRLLSCLLAVASSHSRWERREAQALLLLLLPLQQQLDGVFIGLERAQRSRQPSGGSVSHALLLLKVEQQQWGNSWDFAVLCARTAALEVCVCEREERACVF